MNLLLKSVLSITIVIIIVDYHLLNGTVQTKLGTIVRNTWPQEDSPLWKISNIYWEFRDSPHNLPLIYHENQNPKSISKCGAIPILEDIECHNSYWQHFQSTQATFYFYSAFIDDRLDVPKVIVLASVFNLEKNVEPQVFCQLWYKSSIEPVVTQANYLNIKHMFYFIMCNITQQSVNDEVPVSVSLVEKSCNKATNNIRIFYEKPKEKEDIGVCFAPLNFPDNDRLAIKLVEYILLSRLTGVSKMFFYPMNIDPKVEKVLLYFFDKGYISINPFQRSGHLQNLRMGKKILDKFYGAHDLLALNDCLYRSMYSYKYLIIMDVDEIVIPKSEDKLINIVEETIRLYRAENNATLDMIQTRNIYFTDPALEENGGVSSLFPEYLHMMQHVYRGKDNTEVPKYFYNTSSTAVAFYHWPYYCIHDKVHTPKCTGYEVPLDLGAKYHFRFECSKNKQFCTKTTKDTTVRKYWPELKQEVEATLAEIGWDILPARVLEEQDILDNKTV